jgi:hypothetical protein
MVPEGTQPPGGPKMNPVTTRTGLPSGSFTAVIFGLPWHLATAPFTVSTLEGTVAGYAFWFE